MIELEVVTKRMKEISDIFGSLSLISQKSFDCKVVKDTYDMMHNAMKKWGDSYYSTKHIIEDECLEFFDYIRREYNCFQEVVR